MRYLIRSVDRTLATADPSNCTIALQETIAAGDYEVLSATIPNYFSNVDASSNKIYFRSGSTNYTATIPSGNYSISSIAAALQTCMNVQLAGFTVTLDADSYKLTFANASSFYFNWSIATQTTSYAAHSLLGFVSLTDSSAGTSVTATNPVNLIRTPSVFVRIEDTTPVLNLVTSESSRVSYGALYFPLTEPYGAYAVYNKSNSYDQAIRFNNSSKNIVAKIYSATGTLLSLNGVNWELLLQSV